MLTQSSHTKYQGTAIKYKQRWSGKQMEQYNYIPGPRTQHSLSDYLIYYDISYNYYNITVCKKIQGDFFGQITCGSISMNSSTHLLDTKIGGKVNQNFLINSINLHTSTSEEIK